VLERFQRPRTRLVRQPNGGHPAAANRGLAETTGELLCFLDADDALDPTYFEKALAAFAREPDLAFVSSWVQEFEGRSGVWKQSKCDLATVLGECTLHVGALVRRSALEAVGGFDESLRYVNEDWDLWLRILERGLRGTILQEPLYRYRQHAGSASDLYLRGKDIIPHLRELYARHADALREHALGALLQDNQRTWELVQCVVAEERALGETLQPQLQRRRAELERLRNKLARARTAAQEPAELAARLAAAEERAASAEARAESAERRVSELLQSWSWRVTGVLRRSLDASRRIRGRK
jgi:hypothetical protein